MEGPLDPRALGRLKWRCRRGMLENDLFIERYFARHEAALTVREAQALEALMALPDNDLLDLLLRRREPEGELDRPAVRELLESMRRPAAPLPIAHAATEPHSAASQTIRGNR